jgi:hypothetical protein
MSSETEFANFVSAYDQQNQSGGAGSGYVGTPNPDLTLPPQNVSHACGGGYVPPPPVVIPVPYVAPPPAKSSSSSSSSSSDPINPYDRYRNYTFSNNYDTNNYGDEYNPNARIGRKYNPELQSRDQYGQEYNIDEPILTGFKDRPKKSKKAGMRCLV